MNDENDVIEGETPVAVPQLGDGVYFDLPEGIYHAQQRLSSSGIQKLMVSEADFWFSSWMNPDRVDNDTKARQLGRAYHTARLEPHLFGDLYCRELVPEDRPGALITDADVRAAIKAMQPDKEKFPGLVERDADVKAALKAMGQPQTVAGETAVERALRLAAIEPDRHIWALIVAAWERQHGPMSGPSGESGEARAKRLLSYGYEGTIWALEYAAWREAQGAREPIPPVYFDQIVKDMDLISSNPAVSAHLTDGQPEVSVLWTDRRSGVAMKARIDYLKATGASDFKTFDNAMQKPLRKCIADAFRYNRYYIQASVYFDAMEAIRTTPGLTVANLARGVTEPQAALIDAIRAREFPLGMRYTFQQKGGVPNLISLSLEYYTGLHPSLELAMQNAVPGAAQQVRERYERSNRSAWFMRAQTEINAMIDRYQLCRQVFAEGEPWRTIEDDGTIGDMDFNAYWLEMKD